MDWIALIVAGIFEVGFASCFGRFTSSSGIQSLVWGAGVLVCLSASLYFLYVANQTLPIGTAYAVWTSIGAVGTVLISALVFNEQMSASKLFFLCLLLIAIVGLRYVK